MAARRKSRSDVKRVDWSRWLHDPKHWANFYDELAIGTYAAIARRLGEEYWPDEAVELAVEDISAKMRAQGIPETVIVSYREDYLKHLEQLKEVAREISDVMPAGASRREPRSCQAEMAGLAQSPLALPFWLVKTYWGALAHYLQDTQDWLNQVEPRPEPERERAELAGFPGRRRRDGDVERV